MKLVAVVMLGFTALAAWLYGIAAALWLPPRIADLPVLWQAVILFGVLVGGLGTAYVAWVWVIERGWFDDAT